MANNVQEISFTSKVYKVSDSNKVIDKSFKTFGQREEASEDLSTALDQFFIDYEDLFFSIPILGATGSHEYLANRSGQIAKITSGESLTDIEPLLEEITQLRSQSVADQQTIIDLNNQIGQLTLQLSQQNA